MTNESVYGKLEQRLKELEGKILSIDAIAQDVGECQRVEKQLQYRLQFEELITGISTRFINLSPKEINTGIQHALKQVGQFVQADRAYVFQFSSSGNRMDNSHEWCNEGTAPAIDRLQNLTAVSFPWAVKELKSKGMIHVASVDEFPTEAAHEKERFLADNLNAFIVFGMKSSGRLIGFVGFDWIANREPGSESIASLLQILGVIFTNALERKKAEEEREQLISDLRDTQEELLTLSIRDQLTGIFNRRHMEVSLQREISRASRHKSSVVIIMADVDHFKNINDVFGHMAGDVVLQEVAQFLTANSRGEDIVCRYGGEEFVIILPGASLVHGEKRANELCGMIENDLKVVYRKQELPKVTMSFGVAAFPDHGKSTEGLIYEADNALYQAKQKGRNRVEIAA